jgi:hypothetical protein
MFTLFSHAGHSHDINSIDAIDHCMPIAIGAGIIITILAAVIVYLLATWQPKKSKPTSKKRK